MKLYPILEQQLKKESGFITENGELKKWVILHKAQNHDPTLLQLLLEHKKLKDTFFHHLKTENGQEVTVFNQSLFTQFLEQKNYLNDSYTRYKNKVGLSINKKYLNQHNEVTLVWPYKDCVLEGGQSSEEDQRKEIFFNETLAQDEITQLLAPKVLTNATRYSADKQSAVSTFMRDADVNQKRGLPKDTITDNLIIKGNNLLALHSLKNEFAKKVKLIYIDPPYNTGGDANIFTYNNTFNHSTWLTFMKNRLKIAKDFLRNDGFICIAIDHYELGYLLVLADSIFGRENRIGVISVVNNPMGRNQAKYFSTVNDFMLVYAKDSSVAKFNAVVLDEKVQATFDKEDEKGKYKLKDFIRKGGGDVNLRKNKKSFWYPIFVKKDLTKLSLKEKAGYLPIYPITNAGQERTWKLSKKSTKNHLSELVAQKEKGRIVLYEKYRITKGQKVPTIWSDKKYNANHQGKRLLKKMIGSKEFSFPKSLYTIMDCLKIMTSGEDIIMDFHAGSGTTGHAVATLNQEDNGNRQFILIEQLQEHIEICNQRIQKVIAENPSETFIYLELKKYNQTFVEKISEAPSGTALLEIWEEMKQKSFLNYNVDLKKQEKHIGEFKQLSLKEQQQHLFDLLDKNQLYVNLSSLNDKDFECSKLEKKLTKAFYQQP